MSILISRFGYSTFCIHSKPFSPPVLHCGLFISEMPQFGCRKMSKWNRCLKRQLAKWTAADLFKQHGHMVKRWSSVNPPQLLWYSPRVPKAACRVDSAAASISEREPPRSTYPDSEKSQTRAHAGARGKKAEGRRLKGGTGGPHWHLSPSQRHFAERWPFQQCWSHLWVLSAEAS